MKACSSEVIEIAITCKVCTLAFETWLKKININIQYFLQKGNYVSIILFWFILSLLTFAVDQ